MCFKCFEVQRQKNTIIYLNQLKTKQDHLFWHSPFVSMWKYPQSVHFTAPAPAHQVQISVLRQLLLVSPPAGRFIKVSNFNASLRNPEKVNVVQPSCFLPSCSENPSWSLLWILLSCIHRDRTRLKSDRWINPSLFGLNGDCFGMCTLNTFITADHGSSVWGMDHEWITMDHHGSWIWFKHLQTKLNNAASNRETYQQRAHGGHRVPGVWSGSAPQYSCMTGLQTSLVDSVDSLEGPSPRLLLC